MVDTHGYDMEWLRPTNNIICLFTPSYYHHYAKLSEDIENAGQIYFVECE